MDDGFVDNLEEILFTVSVSAEKEFMLERLEDRMHVRWLRLRWSGYSGSSPADGTIMHILEG